MINDRIWKSYVWHGEKCWFVSTIERDYDTYGGIYRGYETLAWEYDWDKAERGALVHQAGHVCAHQAVCRSLINWGEIPERDDERWTRMGGLLG